MPKKLNFGNNVYLPCAYCRDYVKFSSGQFGMDDLGCGIRTNAKGDYANLSTTQSDLGDGSLFKKGCKDFISSGLPAHPSVLEELIKLNPNLVTIPSDKQSVEDSWDFENKVSQYMRKENILRENTINHLPESKIIKSR